VPVTRLGSPKSAFAQIDAMDTEEIADPPGTFFRITSPRIGRNVFLQIRPA